MCHYTYTLLETHSVSYKRKVCPNAVGQLRMVSSCEVCQTQFSKLQAVTCYPDVFVTVKFLLKKMF